MELSEQEESHFLFHISTEREQNDWPMQSSVLSRHINALGLEYPDENRLKAEGFPKELLSTSSWILD